MPGPIVEQLLALSWTWIGPREVRDQDAPAHFELRVAELPDFFVAGESREQVLSEANKALRAFLLSYLDRDELPPMPKETRWRFMDSAAQTASSYQPVTFAPFHR